MRTKVECSCTSLSLPRPSSAAVPRRKSHGHAKGREPKARGKPPRTSAKFSTKHTSPTPIKSPAKKGEKIPEGQKGKTDIVKDWDNPKHIRDAKTAQAGKTGDAKGRVYIFHNCSV